MKKLAAGNWKMNGLQSDGAALAKALVERAAQTPLGCDMLLCPPATLLGTVGAAIKGSAIALGGQNCHTAQKGAHTGEISAAMLKDLGCAYVILGHSERRADQGETDALIREKATAARAAGLIPIVCIGETLAEREAGRTIEVVSRQLAGSVPDGMVGAELVIAYEPVWAIGTGLTPTTAQVAEVHTSLRGALAGKVREARAVRLLYGGSVKPGNAAELMHAANVDGALVGGASLIAADFWAIAEACC